MGGINSSVVHVASTKRQLRGHKSQWVSELVYFEAKGKLFLDDTPGEKGWGKDGGLIAKVADLDPAAVELV